MIKFQTKGSKVGKCSHGSTNRDTCFFKCSYCYGEKSLKQYPNVRENYNNNTNALVNREKLPYVNKSRVFHRFNLVGDFSFKNDVETSIYYIQEYIRLAKHHNGIKGHYVQFFGYTKSWQDSRLIPYLQEFNSLSNVNIKCSVDALTGIRIPEGFQKAGITYNLASDKPLKGQFTCQFTNKESRLYKVTCDKCRVCINKKCKVDVYFPAH